MKKQLTCLGNTDVRTAQISDHNFMIHHHVLFWNIMMQGKMRTGKTNSYNNGFGIVETDQQYKRRLTKVAMVIAEMLYHHADIMTIGLCEGPIEDSHISTLVSTLRKFTWMQRFFTDEHKETQFHKPSYQHTPNWGLMLFTDRRYQVTALSCNFIADSPAFDKLANRFQLWALKTAAEMKYVALGHFPFGGDEYAVKEQQLSSSGKAYCTFANQLNLKYADEPFTLCADFNFNPHLIGKRQDRVFDKITNHNSILLVKTDQNSYVTQTVTVDGILLSRREKQQYYSSRLSVGLFSRLKSEHSLSQSGPSKKAMVDNNIRLTLA